ncbi:MAG: hypothetical protein KatS3mg002_1243 [Candidatus Woesearchaeota archaeon]|nr:MAG: hypothetical protein KatS3mg002_1243 [Candidatus Woesearchaeota archaeon]
MVSEGFSKYLMDVSPENYFRLSDGRVIKNLEDLYYVVNSSDDSLFYEHVNSDKNDFVNWIKGCIKYVELGNKLSPIKDKQSFLKILLDEITILKNPKLSETMNFFSENYDGSNTVRNNTINNNLHNINPDSNSNVISSVSSNINSNINSNVNSKPSINSDSSSQANSSLVSDFNSAVLDFEKVLSSVIEEINKEIFSF